VRDSSSTSGKPIDLGQERQAPKYLVLKTHRKYIQENYTTVGKRKSALKRLCADSLDAETSAKTPHGKGHRT